MIQAGLHPTAEQVAANQQAIAANQQATSANQQAIATNKQDIAANQQATAANKQAIEQNIKDIQENTDRFNQLTEYDVKADLTLNFKSGSSQISPDPSYHQASPVGMHRRPSARPWAWYWKVVELGLAHIGVIQAVEEHRILGELHRWHQHGRTAGGVYATVEMRSRSTTW